MRKLLVVLLILLAGFPLDPSLAQAAPRAVWWGPTDMMEGWHVRVPMAVHNPTGIARWDATVGEDVDLRQILLEAGWPSGRVGQGEILQVFELDPASVRVVEYRSLFTGTASDGLVVGEVPSRVREGFLERSGSYQARTSPDLHVEWVLPGKLDAGATRYFMIYFDTLANGEKPRAEYGEAQVAPLDARYWIGRGTRLVGQAATLGVLGLEEDTEVIVSVFNGGRAQPLPGEPLRLERGSVGVLELNTEPLLVQVTSDKPVVAVDLASFATGPVPSVEGGVLGKEFDFILNGSSYLVVATQGSATVTRTDSTGASSLVTLTPNAPARAVSRGQLPSGREHLSSDAPILVLAHPVLKGIVQYPSLQGAPFGSAIVARAMGGHQAESYTGRDPCVAPGSQVLPGEAKVATFGGDAYARGRDLGTSAPLLPSDAANRPEPNAAFVAEEKPWFAQVQNLPCPVLFHGTATRAEQAFDPDARLAVFGGSLPVGGVSPVHSSMLGGPQAQRFYAFSRVHVVALYNATQVSVEQGGLARPPSGLGAGDTLVVEGSRGAPALVNATKPILVLPTVGGGFFGGVDGSLRVGRLGPADHRGYLVSLEPEGRKSEPLSGITSPGRALTFPLVVRNLAQDAAGRPVADAVQLTLPQPPPGWTVEASATELRIEPGGERRVDLKVVPPEDASEGARLTVAVTATSVSNPAISDRLQAVTLVRASYEVNLWFDREGGPKVKTITADPGAPRPVTVVVKNEAPIPDRVLLRIGGVSADWGVDFEAGGTLLDLPLEAGEAREVVLDLRPPVANGSQSLLQITAESTFDSSAAAQVIATLRVRADLRIALDVANDTLEVPPGQTAVFEATFSNRGTDAVGIRIGTSGARPPGWEAPAIRVRGYDIDEVSDIQPGGELPFQILVPIPANASRSDRSALRLDVETIPQFVGDPILRESVDLLALAAFRHDLRDESAATLFQAGADGALRASRALVNHGNGEERLRVLPRALPGGSSFATEGSVEIPVGDRGIVEMRLRLSPKTLAGTYEVHADVVSDDGFTTPWRYNVSVPELRRVALRATVAVEAIAGATIELPIEALNQGNVPLQMPPELDAPAGWTLAWTGASQPLGPGEARLLTLSVTIPAMEPDGPVALRPDASWSAGDALALDVRHVRLEPRVTAREDGMALVTIHNAGTAAASDLDVALVSGSDVVDSVHLRRVAAGGNATAVLAAPQEGSYVVRLGAGYPGTPTEMPIEIRGTRETPLPALAGFAVAAAVALALRRR